MAQQRPRSTIAPSLPSLHSRPAPKQKRTFPIPKEDNCYSRAKRYEYIDKDLDKAAECYLECIETGVRVESAVKDLASLYHQVGHTQKACDLLETHLHLVHENLDKYTNLLANLRDKVEHHSPQYVLLSDLPLHITELEIRQMFSHPRRIMEVEIIRDGNSARSRLKCMSSSAAKKTKGGFLRKELHVELEEEDKRTEASDSESRESCLEWSETDLLGKELVAALNEAA